jgi:hypothetical protein
LFAVLSATLPTEYTKLLAVEIFQGMYHEVRAVVFAATASRTFVEPLVARELRPPIGKIGVLLYVSWLLAFIPRGKSAEFALFRQTKVPAFETL